MPTQTTRWGEKWKGRRASQNDSPHGLREPPFPQHELFSAGLTPSTKKQEMAFWWEDCFFLSFLCAPRQEGEEN